MSLLLCFEYSHQSKEISTYTVTWYLHFSISDVFSLNSSCVYEAQVAIGYKKTKVPGYCGACGYRS